MATQRTASAETAAAGRSPVELAAMAVSATFVLVGVLGFVPGITQNFDEMAFAGTESRAELLGIFQVSVLHNLVHLLFGLVGFGAARSAAGARAFLLGGGLIYLVLWIYGMAVDRTSDANFVPLNEADDALHLALAAGMILLAMVLPRTDARR